MSDRIRRRQGTHEPVELDVVQAFWRDVARVAEALQRQLGAAKINYAIFGNLCPHVHCHVVPRTFADDPDAPLNMNAQVVLLEPGEYRQAIGALQAALR